MAPAMMRAAARLLGPPNQLIAAPACREALQSKQQEAGGAPAALGEVRGPWGGGAGRQAGGCVGQALPAT